MDKVRLRMFLCPEHRYPSWNCECWLLSSLLWPFLLISSVLPEPRTSKAKPLPDVQGLRCDFIISSLTHILSHPRDGQLHSSSWLSQSPELHMLSSRKSSYLSSIFTVQPLSCPIWQLSHRIITTCLDPVQGPPTSTTQTPAISSPCTSLVCGVVSSPWMSDQAPSAHTLQGLHLCCAVQNGISQARVLLRN